MAVVAISCYAFLLVGIRGIARMESMNISLPEPLKQFVDAQIAQGR